MNGFTIQGGGFEGSSATARTQDQPGIYIQAATPTISNNVLTRNHCYSIFSNRSSPLIEYNEIDHTLDAMGGCGFAGGAAIWLSGSLSYYNGGTSGSRVPATVLGNTIQENTDSGKEDAGGNGGVGVAVWGADALIEGNIIRNNTTLGEGAINGFNTDLVDVIGNLIYGNTAAYTSAGVDLMPPDATVGPFIGILANNTIYGNTLTQSLAGDERPGGQVWLEGNLGQYILINNIIVETQAGADAVHCGGTYNYLSITPLVFDHNDIYAPSGSAYGGACPDQTGVYGNISADPQFVHSGSGDFHLSGGSPAIDAGNNSAPMSTPTDIAGANRIEDATGLGYPVVDMGVYEMPGQTSVAPTILTLVPSTYTPNPYTGGPFTLTAKPTSNGGTGMGAVTFLMDLHTLGTVTLDGTGSAVLQPTGILPGVHAFVATYPGAGGYPPAVSAKFYVLFPRVTPTISLTSSPNPSSFGNPVKFTVTVSSPDDIVPSPIVLTDSGSTNVIATLTPDASGNATFTTSTLTLGDHTIVATFGGSPTDDSVYATLVQHVVTGYETAVTLSSSLNPSTYLQAVTFTAQVTASLSTSGIPPGSISFLDGTTMLVTVSLDGFGSASTTTATLAASRTPHAITAQYVPAAGFASSKTSLNQIVNGLNIATATSIRLGPNPSTYGQPVIYIAHVSFTTSYPLVPTGTVLFTFCRGATVLANVDATGTATFISPVAGAIPDPAGTCTVAASYSGDVQFQPSTSPTVPWVVNPAASGTSVAAQPNPAYQGQQVDVTVQVTGVPSPTANPVTGLPIPPAAITATGSVSVYDGDTLIGTATLSGGEAQVTTRTLSVGTHRLSAVYGGSANLLGSSSGAAAEVVLLSAFTIGLSPDRVAIPFRGRTGTTITLGSVGVYSGTLQLSTGTLPQYGSAVFTVASAVLPTGGTASSALAMDTVSIPPGVLGGNALSGGTMLPFTLAGLLAVPWMFVRRRAVPRLLFAWLAMSVLFSSSGCTNVSEALNAVAPGTYQIPVSATDPATGLVKTAMFTMTVTAP